MLLFILKKTWVKIELFDFAVIFFYRKEYKKNKTRTMRIYLAKDLHALCEKLSALCVVCICFSLQGIPTPGEEIIE